MAGTVTIRLKERGRLILEAAAGQRGTGLSAFICQLAEDEARRLSREAIRADGRRVVAYLEQHPAAQAELRTYGTPIAELP